MVKKITPRLYYDRWSELPRPAILFVKAAKGDEPLTGAEMGIEYGINAESILETLNIKKLHLVDPYEPYIQRGNLCSSVSAKEVAIERLRRFRDKIKFIYLKSDEAANLIPEGLDFAYTDGNHDYEYVKKDIENYYPKINTKGIIGGHDFCNFYLGVIRAVVEFSATNGLDLMVDKTDWWMQKI
jgi:hypothetical protein